MLGTKCPSIISTWMTLPPPSPAARARPPTFFRAATTHAPPRPLSLARLSGLGPQRLPRWIRPPPRQRLPFHDPRQLRRPVDDGFSRPHHPPSVPLRSSRRLG